MDDTTNNIKSENSHKILLGDDWSIIQSTPDHYQSPAEINLDNHQSIKASVPCTVAKVINHRQPECWTPMSNYDDSDWWFQKNFTMEPRHTFQTLVFEGLATLADVWLNDQLILASDNMFHRHEIKINSQLINGTNTLSLCFRSLSKQLNTKRPRPKWKTKLVDNQSMRWFRTTLLGRIPGWTPPVTAVGPWKPIYLLDNAAPSNIKLATSVDNNVGFLDFSCEIEACTKSFEARLEINGLDYTLDVCNSERNSTNNDDLKANKFQLSADELTILDIELWWPHTHGTPRLYQPRLHIKTDDYEQCFELAKIGFKSVQLSVQDKDFKINVNQQPIFCRGACWTTNDILSLRSSYEELACTLGLMRDAGANMIRIGGTMVYEQDEFYQICDQLGIMVWQDFMFANMDYPFDEPSFLQSVEKEIKQQLRRLNKHPCITIYCGNSEIQQQVAMLGFDSSIWEIPFYDQQLAEICNSIAPSVPYVSSSPTGGDLPFRVNQGLSHYYGVGAYLQPVSELRKHDVRFTSECLGFSNVPVPKTSNSVLNGQLPAIHNPTWKQRTPRDSGTGWDFEDVRDHYLQQLFAVDPVNLRCFDPQKYIQLSELVSGEIMTQVYSEWRSSLSRCNGGLVWFMKDLWPGAGWGIIDSTGSPKACYYYLKRSWQPISIHLTDESLNGLLIHLINEGDKDFNGSISVKIINQRHLEMANMSKPINIDARSKLQLNSEVLLKHFYDLSYSYRFGPPSHYAVLVQLNNAKQQMISESFYFPKADMPTQASTGSLQAELIRVNENQCILSLSAQDFIFGIYIEIKNANLEDNYFHMFPDTTREIVIDVDSSTNKAPKGYLNAVNIEETIRFKIQKMA